jgi:hypothetical protein
VNRTGAHGYAKVFQSPQEYSHRRENWALTRRSGGGSTGQVLLVFRASATGNEPYFPWSCPPTRPADVGASFKAEDRRAPEGLRSAHFDDMGDPVEVFTRVTEPRRGGTGSLIFGDRAPCIRDRGGGRRWSDLSRPTP